MEYGWERRPLGTLRPYDPLSGLRFVRSEGPYLWDTDGKKYLDFVCGYSACNLGHANPVLIQALQRGAEEQTWAYGGESPQRSQLESALASHVERERRGLHIGSQLNSDRDSLKVWLGVSGARAIETAWKIAMQHRPPGIACMDIAYHGRSLATACISDTRRAVESTLPIVRLPFPKHLKNPCIGSSCSECEEALQAAERLLGQQAEHIGAVILEPAIGARGYYFASPTYFQRLVTFAKSLSMLVISDEIQMGLRRMGAMVSSIAQGWEPDLTVFGKSMGGGILPITAVVGRSQWMDELPVGIESETFAGYPLACQVALATLGLLSQENLQPQVERNGERFRKGLFEGFRALGSLGNKHPVVDGVGLASVVSLEHLGESGGHLARRWTEALGQRGILVHLTGVHRSRLALIPPLTIAPAELEQALESLLKTYRVITLGE